MYLTYLLAVSM